VRVNRLGAKKAGKPLDAYKALYEQARKEVEKMK
jgi:hypothetical protein